MSNFKAKFERDSGDKRPGYEKTHYASISYAEGLYGVVNTEQYMGREGVQIATAFFSAALKRIPTKIVTITGPSASGKSSIVERIRAIRPEIGLIISNTSRSRESRDLAGEYNYNVPKEEFVKNTEKYLWVTPPVHTHTFGTLRDSVGDAVNLDNPSMMILIPGVVQTLREYAENFGSGYGVLSFFIVAPEEEELRRRLKKRNGADDDLERRIVECKRWHEEAKDSGIPYIFLENKDSNDEGIERSAKTILHYLDQLNNY